MIKEKKNSGRTMRLRHGPSSKTTTHRRLSKKDRINHLAGHLLRIRIHFPHPLRTVRTERLPEEKNGPTSYLTPQS